MVAGLFQKDTRPRYQTKLGSSRNYLRGFIAIKRHRRMVHWPLDEARLTATRARKTGLIVSRYACCR